MTNELQTYAFENLNVRIVVENGEPYFCASDVCKALGYSNARDAMRVHCAQGGVVKRDTPTSGGVQAMAYIDERNLYRLIMRSKLPSAEKFQDWVCGEVLPSIRKMGKYATQEQYAIPQTYAEALRLAADKEEENQRLKVKIEEDAPRVEMAKRAIETDGAWITRKVAKVVGVTQTFLFDYMRQKKILTMTNEPYAYFVQNGVIRPKFSFYKDRDGNEHTSITPYITTKGIEYLITRLMKDGLLKDRACVQYELLNAEG